MALGRNDPCHCGSGRKYKKCHWKVDQQEAAARAQKERARRERLEAMGQPSDQEVRQLYQGMTGRPAPAGPLPAQTQEMLAEIWQQGRLNEQARATLSVEEAQWESYFEEHPEAFEEIAAELARDPMFEQYKLTPENRNRVLRELGPLPTEQAALDQYVSQAINMSFDEEDRNTFNDAILALLPELVEAGQMREAYVVAEAADRVLDPDASPTPFLRNVVIRSVRDS